MLKQSSTAFSQSNRMASFLGLQAKRSFSTIKPRVFSSAIFMPEMFPARLSIPAAQGVTYDFTAENQTTVADFRQSVLDNTDSDVSSFELIPADPSKKEASIDNMTMGDLKSNKFKIRVNNKSFDVYPDLISLFRNQAPVTKNKKEMLKANDMKSSIPIGRQTILRDFYSNLVAALKKEAGTGGSLSQAKLDKAFKQSIKLYAEALDADDSEITEKLSDLRAELKV